MAKVSTRDRATYTSGGLANANKTFRVDIQLDESDGHISQYDVFLISAMVLQSKDQVEIPDSKRKYANEYIFQDELKTGEGIVIKSVNQFEDVPATIYVPDVDTQRLQTSFTVARGPLHPREPTCAPVEITVTGLKDRNDNQGVKLGSSQILLEG